MGVIFTKPVCIHCIEILPFIWLSVKLFALIQLAIICKKLGCTVVFGFQLLYEVLVILGNCEAVISCVGGCCLVCIQTNTNNSVFLRQELFKQAFILLCFRYCVRALANNQTVIICLREIAACFRHFVRAYTQKAFETIRKRFLPLAFNADRVAACAAHKRIISNCRFNCKVRIVNETLSDYYCILELLIEHIKLCRCCEIFACDSCNQLDILGFSAVTSSHKIQNPLVSAAVHAGENGTSILQKELFAVRISGCQVVKVLCKPRRVVERVVLVWVILDGELSSAAKFRAVVQDFPCIQIYHTVFAVHQVFFIVKILGAVCVFLNISVQVFNSFIPCFPVIVKQNRGFFIELVNHCLYHCSKALCVCILVKAL